MMECDCQIDLSAGGFCPRHQVQKSALLVRKCQERGAYWKAWEQGCGPNRNKGSIYIIKKKENQAKALSVVKKTLVSDNLCSSLGRCKTNKRSLLEIFNRLQLCVECSKFQNDHCALDRGCDKRTVFQLRLQRRDCEYWDQERLAKMSKRIKVAIHTHALNNGGAERWIVDLTNCLDPDKIQTVVTLTSESVDPVLVAKINSSTPVVTNAQQIQKVHNESDIILCWGAVSRNTKAKIVFCSHGCSSWAIKNSEGLLKAGRDDIYLTAVSEKAAGILSGNVTILWNGCDTSRLEINQDQDVRKEWGISDDTLLIGYVGRIATGKRIEIISSAASKLALTRKVRVMIVGMPMNTRKNRRYITTLLSHKPKPIFIDRTEYVGPYYNAFDVFVLPSASEGFSLAMIEAWLSKVPVVSTPVGAVEEIEKVFGQMVFRSPVHDRGRATAQAIEQAVSEKGKKVAEHAYNIASEHFTFKGLGKRWTEYLEKVYNDRI